MADTMGLLTFSINVTLDGCVDHQEGIADDETHAFFTGLMDERGAMLWGRVTYEMMESHWPAVARGDREAPPATREWALKLEAKPKYVVSSTRKDYPWNNSHHIAGDVCTGVQKLKDATPAGVLVGSGNLAAELDRLGTPGNWDHITSQIGMFSFTGISEKQVLAIREKWHVYMTKNGRISMAGLNTGNVKYFAEALDDVVRNVQ